MNTKTLLSFSLILFACASIITAQANEKKSPFIEGETLAYEGKYKKLGFSFSVAELNFAVLKLPETENYLVEAEASSKGMIAKLLNFDFSQTYKSTVDAEKLRILETVKQNKQGERLRNGKADFNYETRKVIYVETNPKDAARPPRVVASTIDFDMQDIVSAIYKLRSMKLTVGETFDIKVSDSGLVYNIPVKVTARERVKSILGKKWCWRIEPDIFGDGRFIEQKGSLTIWMTDDENQIPVRAEVETKLADVYIKLKKIQTKDLNLEDDGRSVDDDDEGGN